MALTEFGKAVRKARIDSGQNLQSMSSELKVSVAFLSAMENGRKKIPPEMVEKVGNFFYRLGVPIANLKELAAVSNESVPIDGLPLQHQMLVAGFAQSKFTPEQLKTIAKLFEEITEEDDKEGRA